MVILDYFRRSILYIYYGDNINTGHACTSGFMACLVINNVHGTNNIHCDIVWLKTDVIRLEARRLTIPSTGNRAEYLLFFNSSEDEAHSEFDVFIALAILLIFEILVLKLFKECYQIYEGKMMTRRRRRRARNGQSQQTWKRKLWMELFCPLTTINSDDCSWDDSIEQFLWQAKI